MIAASSPKIRIDAIPQTSPLSSRGETAQDRIHLTTFCTPPPTGFRQGPANKGLRSWDLKMDQNGKTQNKGQTVGFQRDGPWRGLTVLARSQA